MKTRITLTSLFIMFMMISMNAQVAIGIKGAYYNANVSVDGVGSLVPEAKSIDGYSLGVFFPSYG